VCKNITSYHHLSFKKIIWGFYSVALKSFMKRNYKNNADVNRIVILPIVGLSLSLLAERGLKERPQDRKQT
jgi:hypothetical protein